MTTSLSGPAKVLILASIVKGRISATVTMTSSVRGRTFSSETVARTGSSSAWSGTPPSARDKTVTWTTPLEGEMQEPRQINGGRAAGGAGILRHGRIGPLARRPRD